MEECGAAHELQIIHRTAEETVTYQDKAILVAALTLAQEAAIGLLQGRCGQNLVQVLAVLQKDALTLLPVGCEAMAKVGNVGVILRKHHVLCKRLPTICLIDRLMD